jgi:hypothetical protein
VPQLKLDAATSLLLIQCVMKPAMSVLIKHKSSCMYYVVM